MSAFWTQLKISFIGSAFALVGVFGVISDAEAARLGGKKSTGMQRSSEQYNKPDAATTPSANPTQRSGQQAANTPATKPTPQSGARRWLAPLAGIATALGLAALFAHLGLGEGLAQMMTLLLLAGLAFFVIRWVMSRMRANTQPQAAGYHAKPTSYNPPNHAPIHKDVFAAPTTPSSAVQAAHHVDEQQFIRVAKSLFIRLQAANDKKDMDDLRKFLTPQMYAEAQMQIIERGDAPQTTEVVQLNAVVLGLVTEGSHDIGSIRFTGQIKNNGAMMAEPFSEVWHLTKWSNHTDEWSLAGIQQDA